jgi:RNA polymerase sigma-70 factor (ECF subfamily)
LPGGLILLERGWFAFTILVPLRQERLREERRMLDESAFRGLMQRVRLRDQQAATELVRTFEPEIRRFIRLRLSDPALQRVWDCDDVLQSVLGNFFVRVVAGQFDLDEPVQLIKLLERMARNKIVDHARRPASRKNRDCGSSVWDEFIATGRSPSSIVADEQILKEVHRQLTDDERQLAEQRANGRSWKEIADACQSTPDGVRKKLERALDRVCRDLGLEETADA